MPWRKVQRNNISAAAFIHFNCRAASCDRRAGGRWEVVCPPRGSLSPTSALLTARRRRVVDRYAHLDVSAEQQQQQSVGLASLMQP